MGQHMKFKDWMKALRRLGRDAQLTWLLLGSAADHEDQWRDGITPREEMQELYADAGYPLLPKRRSYKRKR